jgi:Right handed beta helix region
MTRFVRGSLTWLCATYLLIASAQALNAADLVPSAVRSVADYLPADFKRDGSASYQAELQQAIDEAAREGMPLVFPAMTFRLDEKGLQLRSGSTLWMQGARFELDEKCSQDGQAFLGENVAGVQLVGGEIVGHNEVWPAGVNIRGIHLRGKLTDIKIRDVRIRELSSTGIGVFGSEEEPARDVWVTDVIVDHCCNIYADYLDPKPGPEPGSNRDDQGLICFYYVRDFAVRGCRFENSRSDGTHFYKCRQGHFTDNHVYGAKMGGYFLETCADVTASGNIIRENGSRGVTIERGSTHCTLLGCLVAASGREGLWAPDCTGLVIANNIFDRNGRKAGLPTSGGGKESHTANICIDEDGKEPTRSPTEDYLITGNLLYTDKDQRAAIRVLASVSKQIVIKNNLLRGENSNILVEGEPASNVVLQGNEP